MRTGRPSSINETKLAKLEEAFLLGCSDAEACLFAGIHPSTLYRYQEKKPDFCERKAALKTRPVFIARKALVEALGSDPSLALKYLERKRKEEFSLRYQATRSPENSRIRKFEDMTTQELKAKVKQMRAKLDLDDE